MKKLNSLMMFLLMSQFKRTKNAVIKIVKIKAVASYIKAVNSVRLVLVGLILLFACILLLGIGFVTLHIALLLYMDWTPETKRLMVLIFGAVYFLIGLGALLYITSEQTWMKVSKGDKLTREALRDE